MEKQRKSAKQIKLCSHVITKPKSHNIKLNSLTLISLILPMIYQLPYVVIIINVIHHYALHIMLNIVSNNNRNITLVISGEP